MKPYSNRTLALFAAGAALLIGPRLGQAQVSFVETTFEQALAQAAADDAMLLVDVYATWCGPCHRLDDEVFPTATVTEATDGLIALRIDAEAAGGPEVVERYNVVGYPTVLLLNPDGTEVDRVFGFLEADAFASTITNYRAGTATIDTLRAEVLANPTDMALTIELAERSAVRGEVDAAIALFDTVIASDPDNAAGYWSRSHHFMAKYIYLRGVEDYPAAITHFRTVIDTFPAADEVVSCHVQIGIAEGRAGNTAAAFEAFDAFIATAPDDADMYHSVAWTALHEGLDPARAAAVAVRGLALAPDDHTLWSTLADAQLAAGDPARAAESLRQAIALSPDDPDYVQRLEAVMNGPVEP